LISGNLLPLVVDDWCMIRFVAICTLILTACPWPPPNPNPPQPRPLSGDLSPQSLELLITLSAGDGQQSQSQTASVTVTLVNRRLPVDVFAPQRANFDAAIASLSIPEGKKAELQTGAHDAIAKLQIDIDTALGELPQQMRIVPTSPPLGARFEFKHRDGRAFLADGLYNQQTTEFALASLGFADGTGSSQFVLLGLAAASFFGRLQPPAAELHFAAAGLLGVANVGAIGVSVDLKTTLKLARD